LGPDGNIWFTNDGDQRIGTIDRTGKITEFSILTGGPPYSPPAQTPHGITTGPDGNLWFTEWGRGKIGRITTSGVLTEFPLPSATSQPESIALGPDGNLWFTELRGAIGRITPNGDVVEYPISSPQVFMFIVAGADGALWFTEGQSNKIGRITVSGQISEYAVPTSGSYPRGIAAGPDGNIWFVENQVNKIGKVVLSNPVPAGPVTVSQSSLTFTAQYLSTPPASQTFTVSAPVPTSFSITLDSHYTVVGNTSWLNISPSGVLSTNQTVTVSINQSILLPGAYSGSISIIAGGVTQKVQVTLNVAPISGGDVYANVSTLQAGCIIGSGDPCSAELDILSKQGSIQHNPFVITTAFASSQGPNWFSLVAVDGSVIPSGSTEVTNYTVYLTVNTAGLGVGRYTGVVTITPNGGAVLNIPVAFTLLLPTTQPPIVEAVVNSSTLAAGSVSPGEIITVYGVALGPNTPVSTTLDSSGKVATSLNGASILVNGIPAPLLYVSPTQINCVVPYEVAGAPFLGVQAVFSTLPSNSFQVRPSAASPGIFTLNGSGSGPAAILNGTGGVNGPNNAASVGSTIVIFLTGEGQTKPAGITGAVTVVNPSPNGPLTPQPVAAPVVTIGGATAQVSFYGEAPGLVSGVLQINAVVPSALPSGDLPLAVSIGGAKSQSGVTVSIR
jgi:uncharacterized protein (TIGR03437 family)